jgi:hypothetical protein
MMYLSMSSDAKENLGFRTPYKNGILRLRSSIVFLSRKNLDVFVLDGKDEGNTGMVLCN